MYTKHGHLSYCTNIHAGENWTDHFDALTKYFPEIKQAVSPDEPMGIGLRLSNIASEELIKTANLEEFRNWLKDQKAYVFTMNGFPYGGFHHTRVKEQVHAPDWTTRERVTYTKRLFDILMNLLPEGMEGGVSTSPISYRYWFENDAAQQKARETGTACIAEIALYLVQIANFSGVVMHLDIEPEPDGILETGTEFLEWFNNELLAVAVPLIQTEFDVPTHHAEEMVKTHIRICYDVCHFAVGYEPLTEMVEKFRENGIKIGKIQVSAALKAILPAHPDTRKSVIDAFRKFNEPVYLHQVVAKNNGHIKRYRDLPDALNDAQPATETEWRAHFHVPIAEKKFGDLESTQDAITEVLELQKKSPFTHQLEVETYTWEVIPGQLRLPIEQSIIKELNWAKSILEN
ncbi:metabolite traffic protein EboE [Pollutibacter soli]|uniref:metabolite traffic protein EboE n=1 Tax=Pollutibacter soli TaxID=3034157 RepID=UPI0030133801